MISPSLRRRALLVGALFLPLVAQAQATPAYQMRMHVPGLSGAAPQAPTPPEPVAPTGPSVVLGSISFPETIYTPTYADADLLVTNNGTESLTLPFAASTISPGMGFATLAMTSSCRTSLMPGMSCTYRIRANSSVSGERSAVFTLNTNAGVKTIPLRTYVVGGTVSMPITNGSYALLWPAQAVNTPSVQSMPVTNTGNAPLTISGFVFKADVPQFTLHSSDCVGSALPVGATCHVNVSFVSAYGGDYIGQVNLTHNGNGGLAFGVRASAQ